MKLTENFLQELENHLAKGELGIALKKLLGAKDKTGYKNEILNLNSRWKKFSRDNLNGMLSSEQQSLKTSNLNNNLLLLLDALRRELAGEKVDADLLSLKEHSKLNDRPLTKTYLPMLLTGLGIWAICYFAYRQPAVHCEEKIEIGGSWDVVAKIGNEDKKMGIVNIEMEKCSPSFRISGAVQSSNNPNSETDFSSRVGGINNGEIIFVYENYAGERGVCRGVVPAKDTNEFTVHCTDLIGFDKNNQSSMKMKFKKMD